MSISPTIILVPFLVAFLVFVLRFYFRESASSMKNPSFLLAFGTVVAAAIYLSLRITDLLPLYGTAAFCVIGLALLGTAVTRLFII